MTYNAGNCFINNNDGTFTCLNCGKLLNTFEEQRNHQKDESGKCFDIELDFK